MYIPLGAVWAEKSALCRKIITKIDFEIKAFNFLHSKVQTATHTHPLSNNNIFPNISQYIHIYTDILLSSRPRPALYLLSFSFPSFLRFPVLQFFLCALHELRSTFSLQPLLLYWLLQYNRSRRMTCRQVYPSTCRTPHSQLCAFSMFQHALFHSNCPPVLLS